MQISILGPFSGDNRGPPPLNQHAYLSWRGRGDRGDKTAEQPAGLEALLLLVHDRLLSIVVRMEDSVQAPTVSALEALADDLIGLANQVTPGLEEARHRVLAYTLRDAGLELWMRAREIKARSVSEEDGAYLREVRDVLKEIGQRIKTGEYYAEIKKISLARDQLRSLT